MALDIMTETFDWFKDDGIFMPMLNDEHRNKFYQKCLDRCCQDKIVVDIGAGTGLLSILAVNAGAKKVFAVEKNAERHQYLMSIIEKLGLQQKIICQFGDWLDLDIPADIYVSETINTQIFGEDILQTANHAVRRGGQFIPGSFEITPVIYRNHPIFTLDQTHSDAWMFEPKINVNHHYEQIINTDFRSKHDSMQTLYQANQLNKLFTLLPQFTDIKLQELWRGQPLIVDLNQPGENWDISLIISVNDLPCDTDWYMVLFWQAKFQDIVMDCRDVWFGNVSKTIPQRMRKSNTDIMTWYDLKKRNWQLVV